MCILSWVINFFFLIPTPAHTFVQGTGKKRRNVSRAGFLHIFLPERDEELHTTIISCLQFIPQSGRSAPPHPHPTPRPLTACDPPEDTSGDPGNPQFCLTAPALPMILDPITGTFNIYSTSALRSIQYVSHFASQAFPSPGRMALHSTQLTRLHTLIPNFQNITSFFSSQSFSHFGHLGPWKHIQQWEKTHSGEVRPVCRTGQSVIKCRTGSDEVTEGQGQSGDTRSRGRNKKTQLHCDKTTL